MIIRSFAELRRPARIFRTDPERPEAEVLAERHALAQERKREGARARELERLLPEDQLVRRGREREVFRTGANLSVEQPAVPDVEPDLLLHAFTKKRSIRKVSNGGRLKLTGRHAGAYRFHTSALGE